MRILYFSDVHLEVRERQAPSSWTGVLPLGFGPDLSAFVGRVDLLVLAGDIGRLRSTRNVSPLSYAQQAAAFLGCRVILVPGNHEYYRGSFDGDRAALLAAEIPGVTVLDRGEARIGALRVLGATLWTDYAVTGDPAAAMAAAAGEIYDHRLIRRHRDGAGFAPADALAEHQLSRSWLAAKLATPHAGPTLVVTHHVPHPAACHPVHGLNELAPAFCSDCTELIAAAASAGTVAWIYGHHHWSQAIEVHGLPLLSAQPGYPGEDSGWTGPGGFDISVACISSCGISGSRARTFCMATASEGNSRWTGAASTVTSRNPASRYTASSTTGSPSANKPGSPNGAWGAPAWRPAIPIGSAIRGHSSAVPMTKDANFLSGFNA